jgi:soluble lytic murein transglycosylase-like protein
MGEVTMAYEDICEQVAQKHGLDPLLLLEQCFRESRFDPLAVGAAGDMGLMQIVPATWEEWAPKVGVFDPFDPESNLSVAGTYLAWLREQLAKVNHSEPYWMLAAYNWGIGNVLRLLEQGHGWADVPEPRRDYATGILLAADANALARQIAPGKSLVHGA